MSSMPTPTCTNRRLLTLMSLVAILSTCLLASATPNAWALEIKRMQLSNGAVLLVSEQHQLPMVTAAIAFDAGSRRDPTAKEGLAALTAESLMEGSKSLSAAKFNEQVDFMGSSVGIGASRDFSTATFTALTKYGDVTLHMLAQLLHEPGLRDADIKRKQAEQVAAIKAAEEEPSYTANVTFTKMLFGDGPYGHPASGTWEAVSKLTPTDVREFYQQHYKLGGAIIAVAGDVTAEEIKGALEKELSGLQGSVASQTAPAAPIVPPGIHTRIIDRNVAQANIFLGSGGV